VTSITGQELRSNAQQNDLNYMKIKMATEM